MNPRRRRHQRNRRQWKRAHWSADEIAWIEKRAAELALLFGGPKPNS